MMFWFVIVVSLVVSYSIYIYIFAVLTFDCYKSTVIYTYNRKKSIYLLSKRFFHSAATVIYYFGGEKVIERGKVHYFIPAIRICSVLRLLYQGSFPHCLECDSRFYLNRGR